MTEDRDALKTRKKPTDHRQGNLVKIVDLMQRFTAIQHEEDFWLFKDKGCFDPVDEGHMNPKYIDELQDLMRELNLFDITTIGNLYLTSGGRIVLDKGCGECFNEADTVIFTLEELTKGLPANVFLHRLGEKMKKMR